MNRALLLFVPLCVLCGQLRASSAPPLATPDGFAVPQPGHVFTFPRDHGSHPDFKIEWWYLTGHLFASDGRRFGYQATFFRNAAPDKSTHLHLAHMGVVDIRTGKFLHQERLDRAGWDAFASTSTLDIRQGPWSLRLLDPAASAGSERLELVGGIRAEAAFRVTLTPKKPLVVFGENSVSRKGAAPTASSYYLTLTRLHTEGELTLGTETFRVTGQTWMDHEISSNQLSPEQVGWDWTGIQLNDGREIMFYRLRLRDGSSDPASSLTWVSASGELSKQPFTWEVLSRWTSPRTGATYPARVRITTTDPETKRPTSLTLEPLVADQELEGNLGGISYYEGACRVLDADGREIGAAYLELTGYAKELKL